MCRSPRGITVLSVALSAGRIFPTCDDSKKTIKCFKTKQQVKYSQQGFLLPGLLHLETIILLEEVLEEGGFCEYDAYIGRRNLLS